MELSFQLRALPPDALDIIRFMGTLEDPLVHADDIADAVGLSDRSLGKAIRRLVTKSYLQMGIDQMYRLTEQGVRAAKELVAYDAESGGAESEAEVSTVVEVERQAVMVIPQPLLAGQNTAFYVGFHPAAQNHRLTENAQIAMRVSILNGKPDTPQEAILELGNEPEYHAFAITPGQYRQARIRLQVFQLGPNPDDIVTCGGMYIDTEVTDVHENGSLLAAYTTKLKLTTPGA
jgi:hypothetical protein